MATTTIGKGSIRDAAIDNAKLAVDKASLAKVSNNVMTMNSAGDKIGIFTAIPAYTLDITGTLNAFSTITQNGVAVCLSDNAALTNSRTPTAHALVDTTGHTIAGGTTDRILMVTGATTYGWGTLNTNSITADAVTYAKIQNVSTNNRILGRITTGAGDIEELTGANTMSILGIAPTALGDLFYGSAANTYTRLAGNTTTTKKFLNQTGDATNSAAPLWDVLAATDIPAHATNGSNYGYGDGTNAGHLRIGAGITYSNGTFSIVSAAGTAGTVGTLSVDAAGATAKIGVSLGTTSTTACSGADSRLHSSGSDNQNIFSHVHAYSTGTTDVSNSPYTTTGTGDHLQFLQGTNITLSMATGGAITIGAPAYGTTVGTICQGSDTRLGDARTPLAHVLNSVSHTVSGLTTDQILIASSATAFGFGTINTNSVTAKAITYAKIQDVSATSRVLGRITTGSGVIEELTGANIATILGSTAIDGVTLSTHTHNGAGQGGTVPYTALSSKPTIDVQNSRVAAGGIAQGATVTLPGSETYVVGANNLFVYLDGALLTKDSSNSAYDFDYWELSTTTVRFNMDIPVDSVLSYRIFNL